jgi:sugar phosphate isomerase/epimerase
MKTCRREFLKAAGMMVGGATIGGGMRGAYALPNGDPIGFQTYEIFKNLAADWQGTWNTMGGMGYKYADLDHFGPIAQHTPDDINRSLAQAGLGCTICHFVLEAYNEDSFRKTMDTAHALKGVKTVIVTGAGGRAEGKKGQKATLDDWKWMAGQLNEIGQKVQKEGFQLGYHNHNMEFVETDGKIPYDILMELTDPKLVKYQIDVGNLTFGGGDAYHYLSAYPHRYMGLHVKDYTPGIAAVPVGDGILDWKRIFALAKKDGIKNYNAEVGAYGRVSLSGQVLKPSPMDVLELFRRSAEYLIAFKS